MGRGEVSKKPILTVRGPKGRRPNHQTSTREKRKADRYVRASYQHRVARHLVPEEWTRWPHAQDFYGAKALNQRVE